MKPRPFDYVRPDTVEEVLALLAEYGDDARILAGGQSLVPMLNLRLVDTKVLIDISRIGELDVIRNFSEAGDVEDIVEETRSAKVRGGLQVIENPKPHEKVEIRAAITQNKLMAWPQLSQKLPLLAAAVPFVGHFQTRNKGTVCGSIAHADPSAELPLALAVLDGEVLLRSRRGSRVLRAAQFQKDMLTTARAADELITARPVASGFRLDPSKPGMPDWLGKWVEQLDGYDDLHATAAMRRDLFKNIAPDVIAEAVRCAA
jgi:2-furoyl-CoA dehydrogenase FAD binding subunit